MNDKKSMQNFREELIKFTAEKGFIYGPSPEIYDGGVSGFYDFGPLGKAVKNNIENAIRMGFQKLNFYEVECPIITPRKVWEASGHIGGFSDPLVECSDCKGTFRADNIIEEQFSVDAESMKLEDLSKFIEENKVICPVCKARILPKVINHELMLKTKIGLNQEMYNRPETATTTYLPFLNYLRFFREKLPFSVFQIGNAYRNEISPRQHLLRTREFTQAEGQVFLFKDQKDNFEKFSEIENLVLPLLTADNQKKEGSVEEISLKSAIEKGVLKNKAYAWTLGITFNIFKSFGVPIEKMRFKQHLPEKMSFYADDAWDLEVLFNSFGWIECCGCHDRTDYDLTTHSKHSKKELKAINPLKNQKETPHILEIAIGSNRVVLAIIDLAYNKLEIAQGKTKLHFKENMAPIKVAIFPLIKKEPLQKLSQQIFQDLICYYSVQIDESGSIGKRYLRQDSIGTPFCITVDFDSVEEGDLKDTVTIRKRDSEEQVRVKNDEISTWLKDNLK